MSQSATARYHRSAVVLHWLSALLIVPMFVFGKIMVDLPFGDQRTLMLQGHVTLGIVVTVLTVARIVSMLRFRHPAPQPMPAWERFAFQWNHRLIYVLLVLLAVTGLAMPLLNGMLPIPGLVDPARLAHDGPNPHEAFSTLLMLMFVAHVAGVLSYQLRRGGTLARMLPERR